jgi:hypothetical protein
VNKVIENCQKSISLLILFYLIEGLAPQILIERVAVHVKAFRFELR